MSPHDVLLFGMFVADHCHGDMFAWPIPNLQPAFVPDLPPWGSTIDDMMFKIEDSPLSLVLDFEPVLGQGVGNSRVLGAQQDIVFHRDHDFFYQDVFHTYYVVPEPWQTSGNLGTAKFADFGAIEGIKVQYYLSRPDPGPVVTNYAISAALTASPQLQATTPVLAMMQRAPIVTTVDRDMSARARSVPLARAASAVPAVTTAPAQLIDTATTVAAKATAPSLDTSPISAAPVGQAAYYMYTFYEFYHPYVCGYIGAVYSGGVDALLQPFAEWFWLDYFKAWYKPTQAVKQPYPLAIADFTFGGAYACYNWELFFHIPFLIATKLATNRRFEDAQKWFHYVFNPTDGTAWLPTPMRYWTPLPFAFRSAAEYADQEIGRILDLIDQNSTDPDFVYQVSQWAANPFNPHLIARLRTLAYQKATVTRYLDNLIAWGDQLFQMDTIESINEATQIYLLASEILGPRPVEVPQRAIVPIETYDELEAKILDPLSNVQVQIENLVPPNSLPLPSSNGPPVELPPLFYFCLPANDKLLSYWDMVADRLYKIRHCLNIRGVFQQLPLFEPPIDPALLVQAAAAGVDIGSVLADLNAPPPLYRFSVMLQKAVELCGEVKALGAALLTALEKQDAETLAQMRSGGELAVLTAVRATKALALQEAQSHLTALRASQGVIQTRHDYYAGLLQTPIKAGETAHLAALTLAGILEEVQGGMAGVGAMLAMLPDAKIGTPTTIGATWGGSNVAAAMDKSVQQLGYQAAQAQTVGSAAQTLAGYQRRSEEWQYQVTLANGELAQIAQEIATQQIRIQIAQSELDNQDLQIQNAQSVDTFLRDKFTNADLYDWFVNQISAVYFQGYQQAYDTGKRAESAFRYELGLTESSYVSFGYWDGLKQGLMAGERLMTDLRRLDLDYHEQHRREYEITKHVSLAMLAPDQLLLLRETGACTFDLPEWLYDLDYPGHYMRRIKSVSVTIPAVAGPYTSVNGTLTLVANITRLSADGPYGRKGGPSGADLRFKDNFAAVQSIATSSAQDDSGMFQLDFRDERFLPFEGAGAVSTWQLTLPKTTNAFDFSTITDTILKVQYTARDGGQTLGWLAAQANPKPPSDEIVRMFDAEHDYPNEWYAFSHPTDPNATTFTMALGIGPERFPYLYRNRITGAAHLVLAVKPADDQTPVGSIDVTDPNKVKTTFTLKSATSAIPLPFDEHDLTNASTFGTWTISTQIDPTTIGDMFLFMRYSIT
jgi:hypothetical protein